MISACGKDFVGIVVVFLLHLTDICGILFSRLDSNEMWSDRNDRIFLFHLKNEKFNKKVLMEEMKKNGELCSFWNVWNSILRRCLPYEYNRHYAMFRYNLYVLFVVENAICIQHTWKWDKNAIMRIEVIEKNKFEKKEKWISMKLFDFTLSINRFIALLNTAFPMQIVWFNSMTFLKKCISTTQRVRS